MTSFKIAPIIPIVIIIVLIILMVFLGQNILDGKANNTPQTNIQGLVLYKTISGNGGTVTVVDELNKDTKTLIIGNNPDFNRIEQFKRYAFVVRGQAVMSFGAI